MKLKIVVGCKSVRGREVSIKRGPAGTLRLKSNSWALFHKTLNVAAIEWQETATRSVGKAAVGAIVGGALTGGLGLIAGAALGGMKNDNSTAVIIFENGEKLHVRATAKEFEKLNTWI